MSQEGSTGTNGGETNSHPLRAVLITQTPSQLYKEREMFSALVPFASLAHDVKLLFKVRAAEINLLAALEHVERDPQTKRTFGNATLAMGEAYLSEIVSIIPHCSRSSGGPVVSMNYGAIQRLITLYGASKDVTEFVARLSTTSCAVADLSPRDVAAVVYNINETAQKLKQTMINNGEEIGSFVKVTAGSASTQTKASGQHSMQKEPAPPTTTAGKKRKRSPKSNPSEVRLGRTTQEPNPNGAKEGGEKPPSKGKKKLDGAGSSQEQAQTITSKPDGRRVIHRRLRALLNPEKKVVAALNEVVQFLGHLYAHRYNNLWPVFQFLEERVKQLQEIISTERSTFAKKDATPKTVEPFVDVSMDPVLSAIRHSLDSYTTYDWCRYEFDEDLIHPIAHACLTEVNRIEGFTTEPFVGISPEALAAKIKSREVARLKLEEKLAKGRERVDEREKELAKIEEERRWLRTRFGEIDRASLVEDTSIENPADCRPVCYEALPLPTAELYEQALFIWTMLVSVPQVLRLSQMPLTLFVRAVITKEGGGDVLMEEVVRALLNVLVEHLRVTGGPRVNTKAKGWFDAMVEFIAVTSGTAVKRQRGRDTSRRKEEKSEEEGEDEEDDTDEQEEELEEEDEGDEEDEEEKSVKKGSNSKLKSRNSSDVKQVATVGGKEQEIVEGKGNDAAIKSTMGRVMELGTMATWFNIEVHDRLNLLGYLVTELLNTSVAQAEAEKLRKKYEEQQSTVERGMKEVRDEACKAFRNLSKKNVTPEGTENGELFTQERRRVILEECDNRLRKIIEEQLGTQDGKDVGAIIRPIGMDRYKRVYWRFPFDRNITVQSIPSTSLDFPALRSVSHLVKATNNDSSGLLLDDDDIEVNAPSGPRDNEQVPQRVWGTIPQAYISTFVEGLDRRGIREAPLRRNLEMLQPYLATINKPSERRITRFRAQTLGYHNKLGLGM